ncbi:phosphatidylinositol-specific phospholipase C/glycerophosphodiester phosphodiesterase family protein [Streptomyces sp. NPDC002133]|uniref:phosphatidylinositol-specific phospholipase C/glycerophosphodiester phosphodiesterase family protein n=1 Tax=Streptomyces sp. NPDC002133 TaxID=3154409 RepID=UPI003323C600
MFRHTRRALVTLTTTVLASGLAAPSYAASTDAAPSPAPLARAHAHNDYEHTNPLDDALSHGFSSIEADIWLVGDELLIGHDKEDLTPGRTLESLYLDPLMKRVKANHGEVYDGHTTSLQLLIDIKTPGAETYEVLAEHLKRYRSMLTTYTPGKVHAAAVTPVISGDRAARIPMEAQNVRSAFYDGRLADLGTSAPASFIPLISDNWTKNFAWQGVGPIPVHERAKLRQIVADAHTKGQQVRFWATPDTAGPARDAVWKELVDADVDYLNTDDLAGLETFLRVHDSK